MKVTREQLEKLITIYADSMYEKGYDHGWQSCQEYGYYCGNDMFSFDRKSDLKFLLDLLFNPPAEIVQQPVGSRGAEIQAECLSNAGIKACYMCGLPTSECDRLAKESGFDECEYWVGK